MAIGLLHGRADGLGAAHRRRAVWGGLALLLAAEVLALTGRFDAQALVDRGGVWGGLLGSARILPQAVIALVAAGLVFGVGAVRPRAASASDVPEARRGGLAWGFLALHLLAYATLVWVTKAVWEGPAGRSAFAPVWAAVWAAVGLGTLAFWALAAQPAETWARAARRAWASGVLPAAAAVAAGACLAGRLTGGLGDSRPLAKATLWVVRGLVGLVYRDLVFRPAEAVVGTQTFCVEVAPQCAGYEGIGLIWAFLAVYLWFFRRELKFPQALWLLPVGTAVVWLANAARIALLIAIGTSVSQPVALGGFHSQAGWLAFNAVALGLVAVSRKARVFGKPEAVRPGAAPTAREFGPTLAYLGPLLALDGAVMVTTAASAGSGFDALYPARVLAVVAALVASRRSYAAWSWPRSVPWAGIGLGVAVFAVWMALEPAAAGASSAIPEGLVRLPAPLAAAWLAFRVFGSVVTVPLAEELAFRGYLTRRLISPDFTNVDPKRFTAVSLVVSSLAFGALHGRWLAGSLAGLAYALAFHRRGRLGDAVAAHATTNALIAAHVLINGAWGLWA